MKCNLLAKAVVAPPQTFDAIKDGLADISFTVHGYTPGRFPLTRSRSSRSWAIPRRPPRSPTSGSMTSSSRSSTSTRACTRIGVFTHGPGQIFNTKRAITSLKDLEGLKIRVGGGVVNDVAKALGTCRC